jgi:hypothetical protein
MQRPERPRRTTPYAFPHITQHGASFSDATWRITSVLTSSDTTRFPLLGTNPGRCVRTSWCSGIPSLEMEHNGATRNVRAHIRWKMPKTLVETGGDVSSSDGVKGCAQFIRGARSCPAGKGLSGRALLCCGRELDDCRVIRILSHPARARSVTPSEPGPVYHAALI